MKTMRTDYMISAFDAFIKIILETDGYYNMNKDKLFKEMREHMKKLEFRGL